MRHVDPDTLALLALGEHVSDGTVATHVTECAECSAELVNLKRAVHTGRSTIDFAELDEPAPRVWTRIADELGIESGRAPDVDPALGADPTPVVHLAPRRRWMPVAAAAAGVALVASGGVAAWLIAQPSAPTVLATATLEAFPDWPDAAGEAVVELDSDGSRVVRVTLDVPDVGDDFTEVWLISSDATQLVSLGTISGDTATFTIPQGIDLSVYDLVDVSAEPYDGQPAHSGDSIVRGQLS